MLSAGQNQSSEKCLIIFAKYLKILILKFKLVNKIFLDFLSILDHFQALENKPGIRQKASNEDTDTEFIFV